VRPRLTYESDPLFPRQRAKRLKGPDRPVRPPRPDTPSHRHGPRSGRFRPIDPPRWKAIRKDVARGLPRAVILLIYGISEREYDRALRAGKER
jgi:hypothetical protein